MRVGAAEWGGSAPPTGSLCSARLSECAWRRHAAPPVDPAVGRASAEARVPAVAAAPASAPAPSARDTAAFLRARRRSCHRRPRATPQGTSRLLVARAPT